MKRMEKIATAIKSNKLALGASAAVQTALVGVTPAFADTTTTSSIGTSISTALTDGLNQAVTDFVTYVTAILPIGLTVFGAIWGTKKAMSFFKTTAGK
jgi:hypothetical protein